MLLAALLIIRGICAVCSAPAGSLQAFNFNFIILGGDRPRNSYQNIMAQGLISSLKVNRTTLAHLSASQARRSALVCRPRHRSLRAVNPLAVAAPVKENESETKPSTSAPSNDTSSASISGRIVLESPEELKSTWEHRCWVGTTTLLMTATLVNGLAQVDTSGDALTAGAAIFAAYVLSDLGTGIYHWGVDNYGDGNTPMVGSQIAAFQGHHQRPWTITEREFCNNVHKVFKPAALPSAVLLASSFYAPLGWSVWSSTFLFLACMSQQFHAWSHMKKSELPSSVVTLQVLYLNLLYSFMYRLHIWLPVSIVKRM